MALASLFSRGGNVTIRHSRRKDGQTDRDREGGREDKHIYFRGIIIFIEYGKTDRDEGKGKQIYSGDRDRMGIKDKHTPVWNLYSIRNSPVISLIMFLACLYSMYVRSYCWVNSRFFLFFLLL